MNTFFICGMTALWLVAIGFVVWAFRATSSKQRARLKRRTGKRLLSMARHNDYLLLENLSLPFEDSTMSVDYFLLDDKYCYCIVIRPYQGAVAGLNEDTKWTNVSLSEKKTNIDNPMQTNFLRAKTIEHWLKDGSSGSDRLVLPIVVIPDNLALDPQLHSEYKESYMFRLKYLLQGIPISRKPRVFPNFCHSRFRILPRS